MRGFRAGISKVDLRLVVFGCSVTAGLPPLERKKKKTMKESALTHVAHIC
jgi:hypothetical protein